MAGSVKKQGTNWYYVLELGSDASGKRLQKKKRGFKTKKEAERALSEAETQVNSGSYIEPTKLLYKDYLNDHLKDKKHYTRSQTAEVTDGYSKNHIVPFLGHIQLAKLTPLHIQNFITHLNEKGLADGTVKRIFNIVNTSLNKAEKMMLVQKNVAKFVDKPKVSKKEIRVWDVDQVKNYLEHAKSTKHYIVFHLALFTGMRQGEILGLRWSDLDFDNCRLNMSQTLSHDGKELNPGAKSLSGLRSIALDEKTISILASHRENQCEDKKRYGNAYTDLDLICCISLGKQVKPRDIVKIHHRIIQNADLTRIKFHDLRHTHASLLLKQNVHPKIVSERLGHASVQITLDTYTHLLPNMQKDAVSSLATLLC